MGGRESVAVWCWQVVESHDVLLAPLSKVGDCFHRRLNAAGDVVGIAMEALAVVHRKGQQEGHGLRYDLLLYLFSLVLPSEA